LLLRLFPSPLTGGDAGGPALLAASRESVDTRCTVPIYRLHDTTDDDLGTLEHPAPNVEPGDVVVLEDGREALVTARVETDGGQFGALLEVAIAPSRVETDDALP
jgi:hypothetical protein